MGMRRRKKWEVIIVGAGAAGLAAARVFQEAGVSYLVLEARGAVGGRIRAVQGKKQAVELGAEFIHDDAPLTERLCGRMRRLKDIHYILESGSPLKADGYWKRMERILQKASGKEDAVLRRRLGRIKDSAEVRDLLAYVEGFYAADPGKISAQAVIESGVPRKNAFPARGYAPLLRRLVRGIPRGRILLKAPVKHIRWSPHAVTVVAGSRRVSFEAKAVLVTVPIGVLKSSQGIRWSPMPQPLKRSLASVEMGNACKVTFEMTAAFWSSRPWAKEGLIHAPMGRGAEVYWARLPYLVSWMGGPRARALAAKPRAHILAFHRQQLRRDFGIKNLSGVVKNQYFHNWDKDPYAFGAYSYLKPGGKEAVRRLKKPIGGVIHFAGEALADEGGTVEGALGSGESTAQAVLKALRGKRSRHRL